MIYRTYGKTDKEISILGFGGMRFQNVNNRDECVRMMLDAAEAGVNYFDTAPGYMGTRSEQVFGEAFDELRRRGIPFYCATKTFKADERSIRGELDQQLKRLRVDRIDFYHVWCITTLEDWEGRKGSGVLEAFRKLKAEGLIGHICVSSHLIGDRIRSLLMENVFEGVTFGFSAYNFNIRQAAFDAVKKYGLGCVVMNPLGGGIIPQNPGKFEFIKTRSEESVVEAALRFIFSHEEINTALVGFGNRAEVAEAVKAVEGYRRIGGSEIRRIMTQISGAFAHLCTGCRYCDECPESIPIPKFMDAYNHKLLYGGESELLDRLKWHWDIPANLAERCVECGLCEELCTQHLPIMERMKEITGLVRRKKR
jgi:predicted aldo/keto reductase-like oxidoreductase